MPASVCLVNPNDGTLIKQDLKHSQSGALCNCGHGWLDYTSQNSLPSCLQFPGFSGRHPCGRLRVELKQQPCCGFCRLLDILLVIF
jgi:hypothetical protein